MAFVMWDVTSLTSARSTTDEAYGYYYGTKFGVKGHWVKIPASIRNFLNGALASERASMNPGIGKKPALIGSMVGYQYPPSNLSS